MWFDIDLNGIRLQLRINGYRKRKKEDREDAWCDVGYSLVCSDWLNYDNSHNEILLSDEVEDLAQSLDDLLEDRLIRIKIIECVEPDLQFVLNPKRDLSKDPRYSSAREGYEIADISMEMKLFLWNGYPTENHLSVRFSRTELRYLKHYLLLTMKRIDENHPVVGEMIEKGILKPEYAKRN